MHEIDDRDQNIDEAVVHALNIQFFDTSQMLGLKEGQKTVGEYISQSHEHPVFLQEFEINLPVAKKFRLATYSLVVS